MSDIIYPQPEQLPEVLAWATQQMRVFDPTYAGFRPEALAIATATRGRLRAVAVFDLFSDSDCMFHIASDGQPGWLTRKFIVQALAYPFVQRRQRRLTCLVSERNLPSLQFTRHFGWKEEGRLRQAGPSGEDMLLFGMLAAECAWLRSPLWPARVAKMSA